MDVWNIALLSSAPTEIDNLYREWGDVGQVFQLQSERTCQGQHCVEVVYGWTSFSVPQCSPKWLLGLIRAH